MHTYFNWSTGKDSALGLYRMIQSGYDIDLLITTVNKAYDRVSMHGLRKELLEAQVESIGLPLLTIELPQNPSMEEYNAIYNAAIKGLHKKGYRKCGFGDIFLEDLKRYREEQLKHLGIEPYFPLWKKDTKSILNDFLKLGFKAVVVCVKSDLLDESFLGRIIDEKFLEDLPEGVDPCGENGEFHTFCFDGPIFQKPIAFSIGEKVLRTYKNPNEEEPDIGFWFCDLCLIND